MSDFIRDKISNYGSAVTIGVFLGSALTTGILCGAGTYYIITKNIITNVLSPIKKTIHNNFTYENINIKDIIERLNNIEKNIEILKNN